MKRKALLLWSALFALTNVVFAQSLSPSVVSPAGSYTSSGGYSLSQTTGEMTMVNTFSSGSVILTQGFQQPQDGFVGVKHLQAGESSMDVFPNPGTGNFYLEVSSPISTRINVLVLDVIGQVVLNQTEEANSGQYRQALNLSGLRDGIYMVQVNLHDFAGVETLREIKRISLIK